MAEEFKEAFGLIIYKNGKILNAKNKNEVGYISNNGDYTVYVPEKKAVYKVAIVILAAFKNNGVLPAVPKNWKIIYKDGMTENCSLDNLDFIDTSNIEKVLSLRGLKVELNRLEDKRDKLQGELDEIDKEVIQITYRIAAEEEKSKSKPVVKKKKQGRPSGISSAYLIDRYAQDYQFMSIKDIAEKFSMSEKTVDSYATQSIVLPNNQKYAITRNLGLVWDLMRRCLINPLKEKFKLLKFKILTTNLYRY